MGKRSGFERREADFYPTPKAAVAPLIPHLRGIRTFAEPCAGDGALVRHLEAVGLRCGYSGDIRTGHDALGRFILSFSDIVATGRVTSGVGCYRLLSPQQRRESRHSGTVALGQIRRRFRPRGPNKQRGNEVTTRVTARSERSRKP